MLNACFSAGPINNEDFANIREINDFDGMYSNRGDGGSKVPDIYLSEIIWPNDKGLDHKSIDTISVESISKVKLSVQALEYNAIVKKQIFIKGKDFNIRQIKTR